MPCKVQVIGSGRNVRLHWNLSLLVGFHFNRPTSEPRFPEMGPLVGESFPLLAESPG